MVSRTWLFGLILGIALFGFVVAESIQAYLNYELQSTIRQQYTEIDSTKISNITVDLLCQDPDPELRSFCDTNANLNLMSKAALGAAAVGLALLLIIRLAGGAARKNRVLLLTLFKPGLYLTALTLVALILVNALVLMCAIYYGESALIGMIHTGIIGAIGFGALAGVFAIARNVFSLIKKAQTIVIGSSISRDEAPKLWGKVDQLADKLGALRPENIVVGLDPNFFVTEANVVCLNGILSGRTLYYSMPLSRLMNIAQFSSVIGHELGHFKGLDTKFSEKFYPIYRGTASSIIALEESGGESAAALALLPAVAILSYFLECFSIAESYISRARELEADQAGASVADTASFATALVKVHAFSGFWEGLNQAVGQKLKEGKFFVNISKTYAGVVANNAGADVLNGIAEMHLNHPTDSHPSLGMRLDALNVTIDEVSAAALSVESPDSAIHLIEQPEKKEEEISTAYQVILAQRLGIDLDAEG